MTDLFQQLGGALNDFKMKNIDPDSLHEIIGEFAPLIGVATDGNTIPKAAKSEVCSSSPSKMTKGIKIETDTNQTNDDAQNSHETESNHTANTTTALDLSVKHEEDSETAKSTKQTSRKRPLENSSIQVRGFEDNSMIDRNVYKKSKLLLDIPVKEKIKIKINTKDVQTDLPENDEMTDGDDELKSNKLLYEIKTVYNLKYYQCKLCPKVYDTKYLLNRHLITHGSNRPFACELCGKSFSQKCDLNRHMNVHNAARQYSCSVCGKSFKRSDYLAKHERQYCGVQKPHKCHKCHKGFEDPDQLLDHTCSCKTDNSTFDCEHCSESFVTVDSLVEHRKGHLKTESEYTCTRCKEKFGEFMAYVEHFKV